MTFRARRFLVRAGVLGLALSAACWSADLATIAAEPDLVKRSRKALDNAGQAIARAGKVCKANDYENCIARLTEVRESVELAKESLDKTGINPSRSPRHFKHAEIQTRKTLKLLEDLGVYIHPDDREHYDAVVRRVSEINDKLLLSIMTKKKK